MISVHTIILEQNDRYKKRVTHCSHPPFLISVSSCKMLFDSGKNLDLCYAAIT